MHDGYYPGFDMSDYSGDSLTEDYKGALQYLVSQLGAIASTDDYDKVPEPEVLTKHTGLRKYLGERVVVEALMPRVWGVTHDRSILSRLGLSRKSFHVEGVPEGARGVYDYTRVHEVTKRNSAWTKRNQTLLQSTGQIQGISKLIADNTQP